MKIKNSLLLLSLFLVLCATTCTKTNMSNDTWDVSVQKSYTKGSKIEIEITNKAGQSAFVFSPDALVIEKMEGNTWKSLRVLAAPCGSPGPPLRVKEEIKAGTSKKYSWNQEESWCSAETDSNGVPKTMKQAVATGTYRIPVQYAKGENGSKESLFIEFKIQ